VPLTEPLADNYWTERHARAMGSTAHVVLGDAPGGLEAWALAEIERLEQCWSRFRKDSELARLNECAGDWVDVSDTMLLALTCAVDLHRSTGGLFDPAILDALERAGYDRTFEEVAAAGDRECGADVGAASGFEQIEIDIDGARVRAPSGTRLDLGGVGKGLAADLVTRGLIDRGARSALVSLGGDMRARGEVPEGAWRIPVEDPLDATRVAFVHPLADSALVSSTRRIRSWTRGGMELHHIIDPRTGRSAATEVVAVVSAARHAWWAEGIAKAVLIAGADDGVALARAANVRAWLFVEDGRMIETV
jgi:FAD:protein FMN transferase